MERKKAIEINILIEQISQLATLARFVETKSVLRILSHKDSNIKAPKTVWSGGLPSCSADQRRKHTMMGGQVTAFEHSEATALVLAARLRIRTAKISVLKTELGH